MKLPTFFCGRLLFMENKTIPHGTWTTYTSYGCRCGECKAAAARYQKVRRATRAAEGLALNDPRHGKYTTYINYGCRCDACKAANAAYQKAAQAKRHARLVAQDAGGFTEV